jgi:hypothetical protein
MKLIMAYMSLLFDRAPPRDVPLRRKILLLLGGFGCLDLFGATELGFRVSTTPWDALKRKRTFLARFFRSFRSLREGFSTLAASLDWKGSESSCARWQGKETHADQPVLRLKLFLRRLVVVDQGKAGTPSATELCPEPECDYAVLVSLVQGCELLREVCLGDVWTGRVQDVEDELAARQETVGDEFARAQGNGC